MSHILHQRGGSCPLGFGVDTVLERFQNCFRTVPKRLLFRTGPQRFQIGSRTVPERFQNRFGLEPQGTRPTPLAAPEYSPPTEVDASLTPIERRLAAPVKGPAPCAFALAPPLAASPARIPPAHALSAGRTVDGRSSIRSFLSTPPPVPRTHGVQSQWEVGLWDMCNFDPSSTLVRL